LVETWCKLLNISSQDTNNGLLRLSDQEKMIGKQFFMSLRSDRPVIAMQVTGGTSHYQPQAANDPTRVKQTRDLPIEIAQEVVDKLIQKGYAVLQVRLPTEPALKNTYQLTDNQVMNIRHLIALIDQCSGIISIDSMLQHIWSALNKQTKGLVLWGGTNPNSLGYKTNVNISVKDSCKELFCNRPSTYRMDVLGDGDLWHCPYNNKCMNSFKPDIIVEHLVGIFSEKPSPES
jgi:ADP-heptose:LPS heptosyltransferase